MQSIYERIELLIKDKRMTKKLFCEELGISTGNLGDWKRGKSTPSTNKLIEIGEYFNVSLDWLIVGREPYNETIMEEHRAYVVDDVQWLQRIVPKLSEQERTCIKEYIEFTNYRRSRYSQQ
ncbi:helix-turn-helix domain-containing protein [Paenibacillus crassostreae]|uniref:Transcriptional regulator n=1 Tax=Paenibacillus crassostreae TaxID=1763538 RepID=A0A167GL11_9BACL|nr:helix-turn-helix transcriptional regulator [Paenibacillus crassostreae]AOZ92211.1 transcriptional regulator [Paenibacillus crassostreae]OAB77673.1 transcriptional regulator [Paenibacillus crassostreae]